MRAVELHNYQYYYRGTARAAQTPVAPTWGTLSWYLISQANGDQRRTSFGCRNFVRQQQRRQMCTTRTDSRSNTFPAYYNTTGDVMMFSYVAVVANVRACQLVVPVAQSPRRGGLLGTVEIGTLSFNVVLRADMQETPRVIFVRKSGLLVQTLLVLFEMGHKEKSRLFDNTRTTGRSRWRR